MKKAGYVLICVLFLVLARVTFLSPFRISSGGMAPIFKPGDIVYANRLAYGVKIPFTSNPWFHFSKPSRGDIVVFQSPIDPKKPWVKRVIGLPGDRIRFADGTVWINDKALKADSYADKSTLSFMEPSEKEATLLFAEELGATKYLTLTHLARKDMSNGICPLSEILNSPDGVCRTNLQPITWEVRKDHYFLLGDNRTNSLDSRFWGDVHQNKILGQVQWRKSTEGFEKVKDTF